MVMSCHTEISGTVIRSNERGLMLSGRDGWLNVSKYADGLALPPAGTHCTVGLDKAGFIRAIVAGELAPEPSAEHGTVTQPADRDTRIMRQAVLNTAVALLTTHQRPISVDEVLALAGRLESWVNR